jgi:signal transduction histidine kinase
MLLNIVVFAFNLKQVKEVTVTASHNEQAATIEVTAVQGVFPPEQLDGIFDLAVEVDAAGRSKLGQGGLGMPLAQKLAQAHNGKVWAKSLAEAGTTFYLQLPLHLPA